MVDTPNKYSTRNLLFSEAYTVRLINWKVKKKESKQRSEKCVAIRKKRKVIPVKEAESENYMELGFYFLPPSLTFYFP